MIGMLQQIMCVPSIRKESVVMEAAADTITLKYPGHISANFLQSASSDHVTITHPSKLTTTSEPLSPQEEAETETHNPDKLIYSFAAASICPRGEKCPHLHGDICSSCGNYCLHPYRPLEREDHIALYRKKENHLDALKYSQDTECSVCLELVLSKPTAFKRKFGLLSECDHPFCITCIRNWRSSSPSFGMDVNSTLRACPICRKLSFFVIPSLIWYSTQEEKLEIVNSYKAKLSMHIVMVVWKKLFSVIWVLKMGTL